jgi:amidohydrolase
VPSQELKTRIDEIIAANRDRMRTVSDTIHANPELKFKEFESAKLLASELRTAGFEVQEGIAGMETAFSGEITAGSGPVVAMLCEYDALPDIGHGCGHNLIATGGLLAGIAASGALAGSGTIRVVGTPAEEGGGGKIIELEAGVFDDVDAALMFHPSDNTRMIRHATASQKLTVEFHGRAAHAAGNPQAGRSALAAVIQLFNSVDSMRQFTNETTRIHGIITNGGSASNVVPEYSSAEFSLRDLTRDSVAELLIRFRNMADAAALATGTTVEITLGALYAERKNNHELAFRVGEYLTEAGLEVQEPVLKGGTGSSDIGNISLAIPAIHPYLKMMPEGTVGHSRDMTKFAGTDEAFDNTVEMARALAYTAIDLITDQSYLASVRTGFATRGPDFPE